MYWSTSRPSSRAVLLQSKQDAAQRLASLALGQACLFSAPPFPAGVSRARPTHPRGASLPGTPGLSLGHLLAHGAPPGPPLTVELQVGLQVEALGRGRGEEVIHTGRAQPRPSRDTFPVCGSPAHQVFATQRPNGPSLGQPLAPLGPPPRGEARTALVPEVLPAAGPRARGQGTRLSLWRTCGAPGPEEGLPPAQSSGTQGQGHQAPCWLRESRRDPPGCGDSRGHGRGAGSCGR